MLPLTFKDFSVGKLSAPKIFPKCVGIFPDKTAAVRTMKIKHL